MKIITIGVYGFTAETFFQALQAAGVDTFLDIRQRRGVRGSAFAFANSQRLQARLAELGIRYRHQQELAPTTAVRQRQQAADKAEKSAKRQRATLSPLFIDAYRQEVLDPFDPQALLNDLPGDAQVIALFCVEREPAACHRSLVAARLAQAWSVGVEDLRPGEG
jgi:uncharacterized protein (DUF488 family)